MFEQVLAPVFCLHREIIGPWLLRQTFNLIPAVDDFSDLNDSAIPDKLPWRLLRFAARIGFDLDWDESHDATLQD